MRALALRVSSGERYPECSSTACVASFVTVEIVVPDALRGQWRDRLTLASQAGFGPLEDSFKITAVFPHNQRRNARGDDDGGQGMCNG
jgi:hypothetical protein